MQNTNRNIVFLIAVIIVLVTFSSGCFGPSENTYDTNIITKNITVSDLNKTSNDNGSYNLIGKITNTGNSTIPITVITVKDSSGNIVGAEIVTNIAKGESKDFEIPLSDEAEFGEYNITVGDTSYNFDTDDILDIVDTINGSSGSSSSIVVTGDTYILSSNDSAYSYGDNISNLTLNDKATFFVVTGSGEKYVGQWRYVDTGEVVSGYKYYYTIKVISWPDLKVIGVKTLYGPEPPVSTYGGGGNLYGSYPDIQEWIDSL